jgi:hypothetical protein
VSSAAEVPCSTGITSDCRSPDIEAARELGCSTLGARPASPVGTAFATGVGTSFPFRIGDTWVREGTDAGVLLPAWTAPGFVGSAMTPTADSSTGSIAGLVGASGGVEGSNPLSPGGGASGGGPSPLTDVPGDPGVRGVGG